MYFLSELQRKKGKLFCIKAVSVEFGEVWRREAKNLTLAVLLCRDLRLCWGRARWSTDKLRNPNTHLSSDKAEERESLLTLYNELHSLTALAAREDSHMMISLFFFF